MSFVFATSHLPGIERPKEEEEEEDNAQPMLRAGGVRAISHLAQPLGRQLQRAGTAALRSRHEDGVAAAKASGLFDIIRHHYNLGNTQHFMDEDGNLHPHTESTLLAAPATESESAFEGPASRVRGLPLDAAPGSIGRLSGKRASPYDIDPRIQVFAGKPGGDHHIDPGIVQAPPMEGGQPTLDAGFDNVRTEDRGPRTRDAGFAPSPQDRHRALRDGSDDGTGSDNAETAPAPRGHRLPYGRLFEKRMPPGYPDQTTGQPGSLPDKAEFHDLVYRPQGSAEEQGDQRRRFFQNVADVRDTTMQQTAATPGGQESQSNPPTRPASPTQLPPQTTGQGHYSGPVMNTVGSGSKPESENADETPKGMDYALKFIGGSVVDTALNTAVALFGGPGKYSYNPNPLRRHWHVDGWLPKIDREAYNRLQDGAEMLAFSFTEATNPKNRIHLAVPAPQWQNRDGSPISPQEANQWLKEYHANVKKTGSGDFVIGVNDNVLQSRLINGTLIFDITRQMDDGTLHGKDMFKSMMDFYGPAVKAIEGNWMFGSNLEKVNELTKGGTPLESAVQMSWTGLQAAAHGYTKVEITHSAGENGHFSDIQVIFRKPGS